ncbi:trypsin-like peptidase domain-containing protein [Castellaniella caeni]|uniref:trypsin-like peptidase domain-containing protein n=1 Tax=Castellaniella caeni TaxID=266123 RepID=UPI0021556E26|nr:trypsin-like peptidase domain-containing protein [Castellaniella caeni]
MQRLWLIFAQTVTVCLGVLFLVSTLRPQWLPGGTAWMTGAGQVADGGQSAGAPAQGPGAAAGGGGAPAQGGAAGAPATGLPGAASARGLGVLSYAPAVQRAAPSVVNVYTRKHIDVPLVPMPPDPHLQQLLRSVPGFTQRQNSTSLGSGVIVRADGYILTNNHVIESADAIEVSLQDGRQASARLVGADPESDLAVLKIELDKLPTIVFDPDRSVRVGDVVLAIGNPFGVGQTTTQGIVSALGRNRLGINTYEDFIQTDAAINPGNSGGALIDTEGRLVGINTAIYSESGGSLGIGFAIPSGPAHQILDQIIEHGRVQRGWLGLEPQDITPDLAQAFHLRHAQGAIVARVLPRGPAARAGVQVGDIITALDGQPVRDSFDLLNRLAPMKSGDTAHLQVLRGGKTVSMDVTVGVRPAAQSARR